MAIRMTLNAPYWFPLVAIIKMPFQRAKKKKEGEDSACDPFVAYISSPPPPRYQGLPFNG